MKMWEGRFKKALDSKVNDFNSSLPFDCRLYHEDIQGSVAHARMLGKCGIIDPKDAEEICRTLKEIEQDLDSGKLLFDSDAEDIHMFVEQVLTERIGDTGKRLHTARSRNDQVALDTHLYLMRQFLEIKQLLISLISTIYEKASANTDTILPGYTHLQRAQPVTLAHYWLAYAQMFMRDVERMDDGYRHADRMPLGSCALAGTTYPIDRRYVAEQLGFSSIYENSMDGVSDRDFVVEMLSALSLVMTHLSRFSEEIILWCSSEFRFLELDDAYSTGSSIMPQKKNPDIAELVRGKTGRVIGDLTGFLTTLKGLPLAYNKDMQEDKEAVFDAIDTVKMCLQVFEPMLATCKVQKQNMADAASGGFINATDCADYLVRKGLPFRTAYKIVGGIVAYCIDQGKTFETLSLEEYKSFHEAFGEDVFKAVSLTACVSNRNSEGGPSPSSVEAQLSGVKAFLDAAKG